MRVAAIDDPRRVVEFLTHLQDERVELRRGLNRTIDPERAFVTRLDGDDLVLETENFDGTRRESILLNFSLGGQPFFFAAPFREDLGDGRMRVALPSAIHRAERRSRTRRAPGQGEPRRVSVDMPGRQPVRGDVADVSPGGMSVRLPGPDLPAVGASVGLRLLDGTEAGGWLHGEVRSHQSDAASRDWTRVGLDVCEVPRSRGLTEIDSERALGTSGAHAFKRSMRIVSAGVRTAADRVFSAIGRSPRRPDIQVVTFENEKSERITAIADSWGLSGDRPVTGVVIPPAWGRTKETLMPLAQTIVATFRQAREPIVVIRFDGIRKRGESHNDPECLQPGRDHHHFTFSQGVRDIQATLDYLHSDLGDRLNKTVLVSFSAASIESRRAVAVDGRIDGWISVVGAADTQSMMRTISGGIDYVAGVEQGLSFGHQEVLGVEVDIDFAGRDLFSQALPCLDDSRRDFAGISVPVTWIHGKFDAWMDAERARDVLSRGRIDNRKFVELPIGHALRTSREALDAFEVVSEEVALVALGRKVPASTPDLADVARRRLAERERMAPTATVDLESFWRDYLVGRDRTLGIDLMTRTSHYRAFMRDQVRLLKIEPGDLVADFGSGTGAFLAHLSEGPREHLVRVIELDFVPDGLARARQVASELPTAHVFFVRANLDAKDSRGVPVASGSVDSVLASFLLSYLQDPRLVLSEMRRVLKPGGRLVVSSLKRDADISRLYTEGIVELLESVGREGGLPSDFDLEASARSYLNDASKLLDLEEAGQFRFWSHEELVRLVESAGFEHVEWSDSFGSPPQAVVVSARRPTA